MLHRVAIFLGLFFTLALVFASVDAKKSVEPKRVGKEFVVSGEGYRPDIAELKNGGFVVVWRADFPFGIRALRYGSNGEKIGDPIVVIEESQEFAHPVVAGLETGGFVVVYEYDDGSGLGIYVQRYTDGGELVGNRLRANTHRPNNQFNPAVAGLTNGKFVVAWMSRNQDRSYAAIVGQIFSKTGKPIRSEFRVDTADPHVAHEHPTIAPLRKGGFAVAWNANGSIHAQRYKPNGARRGKAIVVSRSDSQGHLRAIAAGVSRGFVVAEAIEKKGRAAGGAVHRFKSNGKQVGAEIDLDRLASHYRGNPDITGLQNGGFVLTWDGDSAIDAQIFNSRGKKRGGPIRIDVSRKAARSFPVVAALGQKGLVFVWWSGDGIHGQRFTYKSGDAKSGKSPRSGASRVSQSGTASIILVESSSPSRIAFENERPGTPRSVWGVDDDGDDNIQGFATETSINVGETIDFKINTDSTNYRVDIYRIGYYDGDGARLIDSFERQLSQAQVQPDPVIDVSRGLVDAGNWSVSASWTVPSDAVSGIYFARLERQDSTPGVNMIPFVVRDDTSESDIVFQTSDTTWQAYNAWGGASLYETTLENAVDNRAYAVSYNRPYKIMTSVYGGPWDFIFTSEYAAIRWLERNGYDVSYISGVDVARSGELLLDHKVFLSVGHDEYWSAEQRANVEAARDAGVNLAFWSGNTTYWKTRWEPSIDGTATDFRTMITYKESRGRTGLDPSPIATGTWRDPRYRDDGQTPENSLLGTMFTVDSYRTDTLSIPYDMSRFRFWNNTSVAGVQPGQTATLLPPLLGYEWDSDVDNGNRPAGLVNLSLSTHAVDSYLRDYGFYTGDNPAVPHSLTMYRAASGALVFSAATVYWAFGLDTEHDANQMPADPDIRQAMVNMFAEMGVQPTTLDPTLVAAVASTDTEAPTSTITYPSAGSTFVEGEKVTITGETLEAGGGSVANVEISVDNGETWYKASGRETWSYTWSVQAAGTYTILSRAVDDSYNIETPSSGVQVAVDLPETSSLWSLSSIPGEETVIDAHTVSLGVRFQSATAGTVSAIRFYKGPLNIGEHTVYLWTADGTLLGSGSSVDEPYLGWQSVALDTPVAINANTTYVASYSTDGFYSTTDQYFANPYSRAPLSVAAGGSVYAYGPAGTFPQFSYQNENYWVDVVFESNDPTVNQPPVAVADSGFATNQNVALTLPVSELLANDYDPDGDTLIFQDVSNPVNGAVSHASASGTITFTPDSEYTGTAGFDYRISDGRGEFASATVSLTVVQPPSGGSGVTLFQPTDSPAIPSVNDPNPVELGLKFSASVNGTVSALRYYKGSQDSGTHVGSLWSSAGTLLAQVTFSGETASGWQQMALAPPVPILAGTTYVVSYHSNGGYAATGGYFSSPHINAPLTAPSSAATGGNGVYRYGAGGFPTQTYNASNYWVDVVFNSSGGGNQPPVANTDSGFTTPFNTALALPVSTLLANDTDPDGDSLTVTGVSGATNGSVSLSDGTITFTPTTGYSGSAGFAYAIADGNGGTDSASVSLTVTQPASGVSLFEDSETPAIASHNDPNAVNLGMRFRSDSAGAITAVRFYKGSSNVGIHTGYVWSSAGTLLGSVTFSGETASGWQQATLSAPVQVAADTDYVVSYHCSGYYAATGNAFADDVSRNGLTAPASTGSTGNGLYRYGAAGQFPTSSYNRTNYFVDVVFEADPGA